jgi:long-chain acyl-CoA synthetase
MPILPLSHVYGLYCLVGAMDLGADCILCSESSSPAALAGGLAEHAATVAVCPPIVGAFLFGRRGCAPAIRDRLRVLSMGGAATTPEQAKRILQALPRTRVFLSYGLAETYSTVCCNEVSLPGADPASVGRLSFGAFGEARDPASGRAVAPGEIGELCLGGSIMEGYVGAQAEAFTPDGLFRTGDLVRMSPEGAITITGRLKEMINAGGLSIYPAEIEETLKRHPAVADCGVFGERAGELEVVCAAVALRDPGAPGEPQRILDELLDHCRAHLALKMVPRRIVIVPSIPRGALGKIARAELRKLCEPAAART